MFFEVLDTIKGGKGDKRNLNGRERPDGGIVSRKGRRERKLTFGRKGAMTGQEEREAGLTEEK